VSLAGSEVTMKRGLAPLGRCSALATTRRVRLQLSSAWPPERGWGPVPQPGGKAGEGGKAAGRTATGKALRFGCGQIFGERADQALVAREAEHVVDAVCLAPRHELVAGKPRIRAQQDLHPWPRGPVLAGGAGALLDRPRRGIDVRAAELGCQQVLAAEHIERQIAVAVVVAVEEAALLMPVQRVIRGVEVENDLLGRGPVRLEEQVDEQPFDRRAVMADLVVARRLGRCVLEPVQRALAGERRTILTAGGEGFREGGGDPGRTP